MVPALVGEGARPGTARDARLGDQGYGACNTEPCAMNDDAGSPTERHLTRGFSAGPRNRGDVDSFIRPERTTGSCAGAEDQGDVDSFIGRDRATGSSGRATGSRRSHEGNVRSFIDRATGTRPGRSPRRS